MQGRGLMANALAASTLLIDMQNVVSALPFSCISQNIMNSSNAPAEIRLNFNDRRGSYIECTLTCVLEAKVLEPVLANFLPELGSQRPSISSACAFSLNLGPPRPTAIKVDYPPVSPLQLLCVLPLSGSSSVVPSGRILLFT